MNVMAPESARSNRILGALPMTDYIRLSSQLEAVELQQDQVLEAPGVACSHVYFPVSCAATLVSVTRDGETSELALTGREGMIGLQVMLGDASGVMQSVVLRPGLAYRLSAPVFVNAWQQSAALQSLAMRHVQNLMLQMAQGVVCSLHHSVLQRLCSWLLCHRTVTAHDQVRATHETIAHMLGVRRESVTQAAGQLQSAGGVAISRGRISILDPQILQAHVCECFGLMDQDHRRLWAQEQEPQALCRTETPVDMAFSHEGDLQASASEQGPDGSERYADIYDFAPVGLLSVDAQGRLMETNMAAAIELGISRSQCHQYRFVDFLAPHSRDVFEQFHAEVLSGKCRRHCEVHLLPAAHRQAAVVRLDATADESGQEDRMVMTDITESHQQLMQLMGQGARHEVPSMSRQESWWTPQMPSGHGTASALQAFGAK